MAININRGVEDAFYRYKMPKLQAKVEGKGNGIKTVIVNATEIANSLSRKPIYVTKYFGCELGAQVNVDEKNERYIVNGAHEADKLQRLLDGFIQKFVLCQACSNPETVLSVKKNNDVKTKCKACGASSSLSKTHRLTQFIVKNPPESSSQRKVEKVTDKDGSPNTNTIPEVDINDGSDDWGEDLSKEAQQRRLEELTTMARAMAMSNDVERTIKEKLHIFLTSVKNQRKAGTLVQNTKLIVAEADDLELEIKALLILVEGAIEPNTIVEDINAYAEVFLALMSDISSDSTTCELAVLAGIILLLSLNKNLIYRSPHILKALYDNDIVSEEVIINWSAPDFKLPNGILSKKILNEYEKTCPEVIQKSQVFINWLKEAEEESSEEDCVDKTETGDESTDEVIEVDVLKESIKVDKGPVQTEVPGEEDDLDIDAI